jgi:CheY-like chemotaxis protein
MATLLYCDDDFLARQFMTTILRRTPYRLSTASDGGEALAHVSEHVPDLILTDIRMPGLDGLELLARLKAQSVTAACPVVLVTGEHIECPPDAAAILRKPFGRAELLSVIESVLGEKATP